MPNLKPPITTTAAAVAYRESILKALPANSNFTPLMTLYLTDTTSPIDIKLASKSYLKYASGALLIYLQLDDYLQPYNYHYDFTHDSSHFKYN